MSNKTLYFKEGEVIIKEGELSFSAFLIESGVARVTKSGPEGEIFLAELSEDEIFGEMGWLDRQPRSATVTAKTRMAIRVLGEEDAAKFITHNPEALLPILRVLGSRLRETLRLIEKFTTQKE